jgi:hypothetical protein
LSVVPLPATQLHADMLANPSEGTILSVISAFSNSLHEQHGGPGTLVVDEQQHLDPERFRQK